MRTVENGDTERCYIFLSFCKNGLFFFEAQYFYFLGDLKLQSFLRYSLFTVADYLRMIVLIFSTPVPQCS